MAWMPMSERDRIKRQRATPTSCGLTVLERYGYVFASIEDGVTMREIARRLGVSKTSVAHINIKVWRRICREADRNLPRMLRRARRSAPPTPIQEETNEHETE